MAKQKKQMHSKRIKLGFYPYTYVRTAVMRSLLFRREDYHKLLKMGFNEIAKFLQESHYRSEINQLATEHSGADLLELALNKSLSSSFKKLIRVSSYELGLLVKEYARRKDIDDIKTILRGKLTNADEKEILKSITAAGALSYDFLASLLKKESVEEILKDSRLFGFQIPKSALSDLKEKNSLAGIENALDKSYYSNIMQFSGLLPKEGALFKGFLLKEIEVLNILTLLRLKKASLDRDSAKEFIILSGDKQKDLKMMGMANAKGLDELSNALEKTEYRSLILKGMEELKKAGSLVGIEAQLYKGLLKQSTLFMHQHPLSIDTILGYMLAKDIEVRNMRIIIKGKQLGLSEEFIESQLVF